MTSRTLSVSAGFTPRKKLILAAHVQGAHGTEASAVNMAPWVHLFEHVIPSWQTVGEVLRWLSWTRCVNRGKALNIKSQWRARCHSLCLLPENSYLVSTLWLSAAMFPVMLMRTKSLKLEAPKCDAFILRVALVMKSLVTAMNHCLPTGVDKLVCNHHRGQRQPRSKGTCCTPSAYFPHQHSFLLRYSVLKESHG